MSNSDLTTRTSNGGEKAVPPAPMPRDKQGWRVAPAPDGRGMPDEHKPTPPHRWRGLWIFFLVLLALNWLSLLVFQPAGQSRVTVPFSPYFLNQVHDGKVSSITTKSDTIDGTFKSKVTYPANDKNATPTTLFATQIPSFWNNNEVTAQLQSKVCRSTPRTPTRARRSWPSCCSGSGRRCCWSGCSSVRARRASAGGGGLGGLGQFGRSQARRVDPETIQVTFDDVAGIDEAKAELTEIVDFLRRPSATAPRRPDPPRRAAVRARRHGQDAARAGGAGEAHAAFFSIAASEFIEAIVGVGAARVRDLFAKAKEAAPAIIFIDELDAIGRSRQGSAR